ncbi:MAG: hypothetical protein OXH16_02960 [Gemmatimonadetes bacterium]|nr:hypothetical protein [Gemmatimonadota bacterium]
MYLIPKYKKIMIEWFNQKQREGHFAGEGKKIRHLCNELNAYDGVCTVYFSVGRLEAEYPAIGVMPGQGFLWLWLDQEMFHLFHRNVFELLENESIKDVKVIYEEYVSYQNHYYPQQLDGLKACIMQISFAGKPMGHFDASLDAIRVFIRLLSAQPAVNKEDVDARYLKPDDKKRVLKDFDDLKQHNHQLLDAEIVPFCDELNTYPGVCTTMSCVGHKRWMNRGLMIGWGYLDLWLDKDMLDLFHQYAFEILNPPIENLEVHYMKSAYVLNKEAYVMRIFFRGKPMNVLDESMDAIRTFIDSLTIFRTSFRSFNRKA